MKRVNVIWITEDGAELPPEAEQYTILTEPDEDGNPQVAVLLDVPERRAIA
jgi:hypothetical protein